MVIVCVLIVALYLFVLLYFSIQYHTAYATDNASVLYGVVLLALLLYTYGCNMEFLDEAAEKRHRIRLLVGYGLLAIAIGIGLLLLIYRSWYGYSLNMNGEVEQSGLVFLSTNPGGATITANGKVLSGRTDARLSLSYGRYTMSLSLDGYRTWQHIIDVQGGDVQRFNYPLLFPKKLTTKSIGSFEAGTQLFSVSPDKRWLIVKQNETDANATTRHFTVYDLKDPTKLTSTDYLLPASMYTTGDGSEGWSVVEWSADNRHMLLQHTYTQTNTSAHEYIMLDRTSPDASQNLTRLMNLSTDEALTLFDKKYDQYYGFNAATGVLRAFSQSGAVLRDQLEHVKAYKADGADTLLYVTDLPESGKQVTGTVNVMLRQGSKRLLLRRLPASASAYYLATAHYDGVWYVAVSAAGEKGAYLYRDPFAQASETENVLPQPWRFLRIDQPGVLVFSDNGRFLLLANGQNCTVYDAELVSVRRFTIPRQLDSPQTAVAWFDGYRLSYVSGSVLNVLDYDDQNAVQLQTALAAYPTFVSNDGKYIMSFSSGDAGAVKLDNTALTVKK